MHTFQLEDKGIYFGVDKYRIASPYRLKIVILLAKAVK